MATAVSDLVAATWTEVDAASLVTCTKNLYYTYAAEAPTFAARSGHFIPAGTNFLLRPLEGESGWVYALSTARLTVTPEE